MGTERKGVPEGWSSGNKTGKPWCKPRVVRLLPGTTEFERARQALLGREDS
jgi:hypothetical protein